MAKDPAFLFYYDRFLAGTMTMTNEEVGQYIRLMCVQANKGFVTPKDMFKICGSHESEVHVKFKEIATGKFINTVLAEIVDQRKAFTESRRNNRKKGDYNAVRLYLMLDHMSGHIKVGCSNKPERRLLEVRSSRKNERIDLIWMSGVTTQKEEASLHELFYAKRIENEWYKLSKEDIETIKNRYNHIKDHMSDHMVNVNVIVNKNINVNKDVIVKAEKAKTPELVFPFDNLQFREKWKQWIQFRKEINRPYKSRMSQQAQLKKLSEYPEQTAIAMIDQSIANSWQGIFEIKQGNNGKLNNPKTENDRASVEYLANYYGTKSSK